MIQDRLFASNLFIVLTTIDSQDRASFIAEKLLELKLAACVNCREVNSKYLWNEKLTLSKEFELLIKTNQACLPKLIEKINDLHTYDLPEIIFWHAKASPDYIEWVNSSCNIST